MAQKNHIKHCNQIRICGGTLRGRKLSFPSEYALRPTPEVARERLFNWLGQDLTGYHVLDLFSGSGSLAFESLSRYASHVTMCENNEQVIKYLKKNIKELNVVNQVQLVAKDAMQFLRCDQKKYHLVLLDPPFAWQNWQNLFPFLEEKLSPSAFVYIESGIIPQLPNWLNLYRQGEAGKSHQVLARYDE